MQFELLSLLSLLLLFHVSQVFHSVLVGNVVLVEDLISETLRLKKLLQNSYGVFFGTGRSSSLRFLDKAVIFSIFHF